MYSNTVCNNSINILASVVKGFALSEVSREGRYRNISCPHSQRLNGLEPSPTQIYNIAKSLAIVSWNRPSIYSELRCPDYWGGLISGVSLYLITYTLEFHSGLNTGGD